MSLVADPFSISVRADNGAIVAEIGGELDLATGSMVRDNLRRFGGRSDRVVYELRGVSFIDSAGVESLLKAPANGERVVFKNPSYAVRRILELLELDSTIENSVS